MPENSKTDLKLDVDLSREATVAEREQATHEASLGLRNLKKFIRILRFRLFHQGPVPTFWWVVNMLVRRLTGRPHYHTSRVTPHLYVGGQYWRKGWPVMSSWGITSVVNLREEYDDRRAGIAPERYLYLPTPDDGAPSLEQLHAGVEFIRQEIASGGQVYIHCGAGVGRAATMAAAYFVSTGMNASQAWAMIRKARPFINPSREQIIALDDFADHQAQSVRKSEG